MIFIVKNIRAARVNLLMDNFTAGLPSPLSFIGLADAIVRDLELTPWSGKVIPVLHHVSVSDGRTKPEYINKSGAFISTEILEDMVGTVDLSLILNIPGCDSEAGITSSMTRRRIAGGIIQKPNVIKVEHVTGDGSAFHRLPRGYAILAPDTDKTDHCLVSNGRQDTFESIIKVLFSKDEHSRSGWMIPVATGYRLLENPDIDTGRSCRRNPSLPHVFAEPLSGLAEMVSIRNPRLTEADGDSFLSLFWSWHASHDLIFGHHAYLSNVNEKEMIFHG